MQFPQILMQKTEQNSFAYRRYERMIGHYVLL